MNPIKTPVEVVEVAGQWALRGTDGRRWFHCFQCAGGRDHLDQIAAALNACEKLDKTRDGFPVTIGDLVVVGEAPREAICEVVWDEIPGTGGVRGIVVLDANGDYQGKPCDARLYREAARGGT